MPDPHITEPMTLLTDYLLAGVCLLLAVLLWRRGADQAWRGVRLWLIAFVVSIAAAAAGGTAHGFRLFLTPAVHDALWTGTIVLVAVSSLLLISAGAVSAFLPVTTDPVRRRAGKHALKIAVFVTLIGMLVLVTRLSLHHNLNHNDLFHLIQALGLFFLYRGALILADLVDSELPGRAPARPAAGPVSDRRTA